MRVKPRRDRFTGNALKRGTGGNAHESFAAYRAFGYNTVLFRDVTKRQAARCTLPEGEICLCACVFPDRITQHSIINTYAL